MLNVPFGNHQHMTTYETTADDRSWRFNAPQILIGGCTKAIPHEPGRGHATLVAEPGISGCGACCFCIGISDFAVRHKRGSEKRSTCAWSAAPNNRRPGGTRRT